jgi:hypothetical protein
MPDSFAQIREAACAIGLTLPEDRLSSIAASFEAAQQQVDRIRTNPTPVPGPTAFDPAWSQKK